ncbi:MAG: Ig-like domain-containing protein [Euryarchaeota archaeon]|nr:Ig-like domain-containing protein [Euryarchaeota archaeon]
MRKIVPFLVVGILVLSGLGAVALNSDTKQSNGNDQGKEVYTHTVLVEVGTAQWCGPCASWNTNIYNAYNSGSYDFEYVEMIYSDHNSNILNNLAYSWMNIYNPTYIPASIFDGDYQRLEGNYPAQLPGALNTCGQRTVNDIDASLSLTWLGSATILIEIQITNHESTQYNGHIRVPIAEIVSRYDTATGTDYHHGFLDYAFPMNQAISIAPGDTYTNSVTWIGSDHHDNHGDDFGDITQDNIQVILGVFNNQNNYIDETVAATIGGVYTPSNPSPADGATNVDVNTNLGWTGGPGTSITYDVYFGTTSPPPKVASNHSGTTYDSGTMNYQTTYYWKIVAWDGQGNSAEGPIWHFTTLNNPDEPPSIPDISGPSKGKPGTSYKFDFVSTDPEDDSIYYFVDWGDGTYSEWLGPYASGATASANHVWSTKATYIIKAKAKDDHGAESDWGTFQFSAPRLKISSNTLFLKLLERFPHAFPILRNLLGA